MKPPRRTRVDATVTEDPFESVISAVKAGRLVALLRGEGLSKGSVQEVLRPESAAKLQAILTQRAFTGRADTTAGPQGQPGRTQPEDGKVLVFKAKETFTP